MSSWGIHQLSTQSFPGRCCRRRRTIFNFKPLLLSSAPPAPLSVDRGILPPLPPPPPPPRRLTARLRRPSSLPQPPASSPPPPAASLPSMKRRVISPRPSGAPECRTSPRSRAIIKHLQGRERWWGKREREDAIKAHFLTLSDPFTPLHTRVSKVT